MMAWLGSHARALLLLPWLGLILGLLISGGYLDYVAEWHFYIQVLALAILAFTFVGELINTGLTQAGAQVHAPGGDHAGHFHGPRLSLTLVLAHLIPIVLLLAVGLSASGLRPGSPEQMGVASGSAVQNHAGTRPQQFTPDGYLRSDIFKLYGDVAKGGELPPKVQLVGQIHAVTPEKLQNIPAPLREVGVRYFLYRFLISCCAADARPISLGLVLKEPLKQDRAAWFQIKGRPFSPGGNKGLIALEVHDLAKTAKPKNPYLSGLF